MSVKSFNSWKCSRKLLASTDRNPFDLFMWIAWTHFPRWFHKFLLSLTFLTLLKVIFLYVIRLLSDIKRQLVSFFNKSSLTKSCVSSSKIELLSSCNQVLHTNDATNRLFFARCSSISSNICTLRINFNTFHWKLQPETYLRWQIVDLHHFGLINGTIWFTLLKAMIYFLRNNVLL